MGKNKRIAELEKEVSTLKSKLEQYYTKAKKPIGEYKCRDCEETFLCGQRCSKANDDNTMKHRTFYLIDSMH